MSNTIIVLPSRTSHLLKIGENRIVPATTGREHFLSISPLEIPTVATRVSYADTFQQSKEDSASEIIASFNPFLTSYRLRAEAIFWKGQSEICAFLEKNVSGRTESWNFLVYADKNVYHITALMTAGYKRQVAMLREVIKTDKGTTVAEGSMWAFPMIVGPSPHLYLPIQVQGDIAVVA